ncbi:MAG: energy transducer TonB [Gammaproteobacteria bacterium]
MLHRPQHPIRFFCAALGALALLSNAPILLAQQQSPSSSTSTDTNLGTLVVSPEKAPQQASAPQANLRVQRQALNFNLGSGPAPSAIPTQATPKRQPVHVVRRVGPRPLQLSAPHYPVNALANHREGTVTVAFTIQPDGSTADIRIVKSEPPGVFDNAARAAVRRWLFQPATADGTPVASKVRQTLIFHPPAGANPEPTAQPKSQLDKSHQTPADSVPGNVHPTHLVAPQYPPNAYRSGQGGSVTVSFMVTRSGQTSDIQVLASKPRHVFDNAAQAAVRQWRFKPVKTPTKVVQTIHFTPPD